MNIQTNDEKNTIPVTEDDAFSYDGYQVVRGEFFAHTYEPSFTFNSSKVSVNTACIKKLPDTDSHIVLPQACMQIPVLINIIQNRSVKGDHRQAQL